MPQIWQNKTRGKRKTANLFFKAYLYIEKQSHLKAYAGLQQTP